jgi:hypothetical protein
MANSTDWSREQTSRVRDFYNIYTRGFSAEAFQRLFTRDTRDAYRYFSIAGLAFLIVLEVFERLSLKNDLEIARDIQQAMLPRGLYSAGGFDAVGITRAANTVGGDNVECLSEGGIELGMFDSSQYTAERHAQDVRFADDLTVLLARRTEDRDSGLGTRDSWDGVPPVPGTEDTSAETASAGLPEPRIPNRQSRIPNPEPRNPPAPPSVQEP